MKQKNIYLILFVLIISALSCWVILSDSIYLGHDTLFHLSRIEGYANSIANGNFFADIYQNKNDGFGYGSALFYCDFLLLIPALLYNLNIPLTLCYAVLIFLISCISCLGIIYATKKITSNPYAPYLSSILLLFSNYRITNLYTRGALGEVMALMGSSIVIGALANLFIHKNKSTFSLSLGLLLLVFSHNLSFALWCLTILILCCIFYKTIFKYPVVFKSLATSAIITFGISACFTLPMIQQSNAQPLYLHYYATHSNLNKTAQPLWTLLNPFTIVNGSAGYNHEFYQMMNVSLGWGATFLPMIHFFIHPNPKVSKFIFSITLLAYGYLMLATGIINFELLPFLKIMQFAFRFIGIALPMLSISASIAICNNFYYPKALITSLICLTLIGIFHQYPYLNASITIDSSVRYNNLLDGTIIDPYFGNSQYVRVEVAGADYLPIGSLNTKDMSKNVEVMATNQQLPFTNHQFSIMKSGSYILPITYYKGYQVCKIDSNDCIETKRNHDGRVVVDLMEAGSYQIYYRKTPLHILSIYLSIFTLLTCIIISLYKRYQK